MIAAFSWVVVAAALVATAFLGFRGFRTTDARQARTLAFACAGIAVLLLLCGVVGYAAGMNTAFESVALAAPSTRASLLARGISEAMNAVAFTVATSVVPVALGIALLVRSSRLGKPTVAAPFEG